MKTIRVERIAPFEMDGPHPPYYAVHYAVHGENGEPEMWMFQRFAFAPTHNVPRVGFSQLVWEATGAPEAPTLMPSFLCVYGDVRIHLYLRAGRIDLLSDSTVALA